MPTGIFWGVIVLLQSNVGSISGIKDVTLDDCVGCKRRQNVRLPRKVKLPARMFWSEFITTTLKAGAHEKVTGLSTDVGRTRD